MPTIKFPYGGEDGSLFMADITAFGTLFSAFGCKLNYNSEKVGLEVIDSPTKRVDVVEKAVADILHFDHTANYLDGAAALVIAQTIDGAKNPLSSKIRHNILEGLGLTHNDRFVYQVLSLQKNNRAWHFSDTANSCSHFGNSCTHRGVNPDPNRKGKRSNRLPNQYHVLDSHEKITREQLVTPNLERLFQNIPQENLVSGQQGMHINLNLKALSKMPLDQKLAAISILQESI